MDMRYAYYHREVIYPRAGGKTKRMGKMRKVVTLGPMEAAFILGRTTLDEVPAKFRRIVFQHEETKECFFSDGRRVLRETGGYYPRGLQAFLNYRG